MSSEDEVATTPPGKWANVFGFTYFRYTERGSGNKKKRLNGMIGRMADGVANVVGEKRARAMLASAEAQSEIESRAIANREKISRALYAWRAATPKDEKKAKGEILALGKANGELLADLLQKRIAGYGDAYRSLEDEQKNMLARVRKGEYRGPMTLSVRRLAPTREAKKESTLILGKFLTWATSTPDMAGLIDAGRPAVFFGFAGLRLDNRASNQVRSGLRRDASRVLLDALDAKQMAALKNLVEEQKPLLDLYLTTRAALCSQLNPQTWAESAEVDWDEVRSLCIVSEMAEVRLGILQARRMGAIMTTLTEEQLTALKRFKTDTSKGAGRSGRNRRRSRSDG